MIGRALLFGAVVVVCVIAPLVVYSVLLDSGNVEEE